MSGFFLVDPLDGTREFLSRNGEFTVNIAFVEKAAPVSGIVLAPALPRLFWAEADRGAYEAALSPDLHISDPNFRRLSAAPLPSRGLRVVASRSHLDPMTKQWLRSRDVGELVPAGSSLKFCLVAAGEADIYPRFGRTMEWDTAAGHAILAAAGGKVLSPDGKPLAYGKSSEGFANSSFIASGP
jgi:3'(2'), 5'-bisphosphate nucleotidase